MRKYYQSEWLGIPFESFTKMTSLKLADGYFYSSFYEVFFRKYRKIEELDPSWVELKLQVMKFLKLHSKFKREGNILSIGCGLGIVEKGLIEEGFTNLEITEVSQEPLKWLLPKISHGNIHIGLFPECLPANRLYDLIYISSVEYCFDQDQLNGFLKCVKERLVPEGICLIISWSLEPVKISKKVVVNIKEYFKFLLDKFGLRNRGQFWGYMRTSEEFHNAMYKAGFLQVNDGFLEKHTRWDTYWIEGNKS